jgi:ribonuclease HI
MLKWVYSAVAMFSDPNALKIYVDGNAYKNPGGPGGYAGVVEFPDDFQMEPAVIFQRGYKSTTNNRMELRACIEALRYATRNAAGMKLRRILIISDSLYVCDNQNMPVFWRKDGWRSRDGRPISNVDLWKEFLTERAKVRIPTEIVWEAGKTRDVLKRVGRLLC